MFLGTPLTSFLSSTPALMVSIDIVFILSITWINLIPVFALRFWNLPDKVQFEMVSNMICKEPLAGSRFLLVNDVGPALNVKTVILVLIFSNHIHYEVYEWISNFIPQFTGYVTTHPLWDEITYPFPNFNASLSDVGHLTGCGICAESRSRWERFDGIQRSDYYDLGSSYRYLFAIVIFGTLTHQQIRPANQVKVVERFGSRP